MLELVLGLAPAWVAPAPPVPHPNQAPLLAQTPERLSPVHRRRRALDAHCPPVPVGRALYVDGTSLVGLDPCEPSAGMPWSTSFSPDGRFLYTTLFGGVLSGSCSVVKLDALTLQPLATLQVEAGPEEVAFLSDELGQVVLGFVSNSTAGSVSVFDAQDQVLTSVPLPFDPLSTWPTAFPFGLAVSPDGSTVWVGTLDGSGDVYAIDVATLSLDPGRTLAFGDDHAFGRMIFAGEDLVLPTTIFDPGFLGSTAQVILVDPENPGGARRVTLDSSSDGSTFPSPQDAVLICERRVVVAGFDMGPRVFLIEPGAGELVRAIPTGTSQPQGKFQALGASRDGLIAVADFFTGEIAFLDGWTGSWLETLSAGALPDAHFNINEIAFSRDGRSMALVAQTSRSVGVFDVR